MAFAFEEVNGGDMTVTEPSVTRRFRAKGVTGLVGIDAFDYVTSYALANTAKTIVTPMGQLYRQDIQLHENRYARSYDISVPYGRKKRESGAYQITVDQTGGMVNVKAGTRIAGYVATAGDLVDNGGLIGVEGEDVKGTEIPVEQTRITVNFRHPQGVLNPAYIKAIGQIVGYPNSDPFLGYEPGEVLYKGGNFTESNSEATATYNFDISFNRANIVIGGITVVEKFGWDVLSFVYRDEEFDNGTNIVPVKTLKCIEVIRPAGREWVAYQASFGWGGP